LEEKKSLHDPIEIYSVGQRLLSLLLRSEVLKVEKAEQVDNRFNTQMGTGLQDIKHD
jgi:hypothetical protein